MVMRSIKNLFNNEAGQIIAEYALVTVLIGFSAMIII